MIVKVKKQQKISTTFTQAFLAGTAETYQGCYQSTHPNPKERRLTVDDQNIRSHNRKRGKRANGGFSQARQRGRECRRIGDKRHR